MPPKNIKKPKQKPKQKQKQKQVVKQNVKVTVQSSGGSGGGGTPSYLPQQYTDTRQIGLLDEIARSLRKAPVVAPVRVPAPVEAPIEAPVPVAPLRGRIYPRPPQPEGPDPYNDESTVNSVFNAPIDTDSPIELGLNNDRPFTRKKTRKPIVFDYEPSSGSEGYEPSSGGENQPIGRSVIYEESARNLLRTYAPPSLMSEIMSSIKENPSGALLFEATGNY